MSKRSSSEDFFEVREPESIEALASPVRHDLTDTLALRGPSTVAELAEVMDRPASSLYPHLRRLVEVGIVKESGVRRHGRHVESVYETPNRYLRAVYNGSDERVCRAYVSLVGALLRHTQRLCSAWYASGRAITKGPERTNVLAHGSGWLTPAERRKLVKLAQEMDEIVVGATPRPNTRQYTITSVITPTKPPEKDLRGAIGDEPDPDHDDAPFAG